MMKVANKRNKVKSYTIFGLLILFSLIPMYKLKSRLGINFFKDAHGSELVEKWTGGLIKADWIKHNYIHRPYSNRVFSGSSQF